ncbi:MAG TPA: biotin--[acetyl-CoA-carboxylase] ligase [Flavobacteriaceae bacterium]|nr:biotin--[acetyl-CoA-carboxylase] ligase [Flavobacteriaceae bacterium]HIN97812.1 biotin--[acetyl-CoA-carboxylase] ligase [Flavobacteriaceae bacterium]
MNIIKLNAIGSTNSYLKQLAATTSLTDEVVVVATQQESGRGQQGAFWQSEAGKSLTCSLFKRFEGFSLEHQARLNFAVSLALLDVLETYGIPKISVKWPNDIMSRQQKLAGILIENTVQRGNLTATVVGVGLNVNEESFNALPQATSMLLASGQRYNLEEVLQKVATEIFKVFKEIPTIKTNELKKRYEARLFRKGVVSTFEVAGVKKNGQIIGVTESGMLQVAHDDDAIATYGLREIKLLF